MLETLKSLLVTKIVFTSVIIITITEDKHNPTLLALPSQKILLSTLPMDSLNILKDHNQMHQASSET
jgi:hypothetical protein